MIDLGIEEQIQAKGLNAPRVSPQDIDALMEAVTYRVVVPEGTTSTFVHAFLHGRFFLGSGHSACVSPENFNAEIGQSIAMTEAKQVARDKLWELEGYSLYKLSTIPAPEVMVEANAPKLGDQVFYYEQVANQTSDPMLAVVAHVYGGSTLALTVHAPNGTVHARDKVAFLYPDEAPLETLIAYARHKF